MFFLFKGISNIVESIGNSNFCIKNSKKEKKWKFSCYCTKNDQNVWEFPCLLNLCDQKKSMNICEFPMKNVGEIFGIPVSSLGSLISGIA